MRKILLFIAAFVAALISMPLVFGLLTQNKIKTLLAEAGLPEGTVVDVKSYKMGYLSSQGLINITLMEPQDPTQPTAAANQKFSFNIETEVQHGPFINDEHTSKWGIAHIHAFIKPEDLALSNEGLAKIIGAIFTDKEVVSINATVSFSGNTKIKLQSSPANYKGDDGNISWGGINATLKMAGNNNAMDVSIDIAPLLMESANHSALDFAKITMNSNATRESGLPWVGKQSLSIPSFYMKDGKSKELRFSNLLISAVTTVENKNTEMKFDATADTLDAFAQKIDALNLALSISKLEARSFVKFGELSQTNVKVMTDEQKKEFTRLVVTMLSPGAHLNLLHTMKVVEGPVSSQIDIQFPDISNALSKESEEALSQRLLKEMTASVNLQTPRLWLENTLYKMAIAQIPEKAPMQHDPVTNTNITPQEMIRRQLSQQIKTYIQAGILATDGTHYSLNLSYGNGSFTLNGKTLSQEDLGQLMTILSR